MGKNIEDTVSPVEEENDSDEQIEAKPKTKQRRQFEFTEARKSAWEKARKAREENIQKKKDAQIAEYLARQEAKKEKVVTKKTEKKKKKEPEPEPESESEEEEEVETDESSSEEEVVIVKKKSRGRPRQLEKPVRQKEVPREPTVYYDNIVWS